MINFIYADSGLNLKINFIYTDSGMNLNPYQNS